MKGLLFGLSELLDHAVAPLVSPNVWAAGLDTVLGGGRSARESRRGTKGISRRERGKGDWRAREREEKVS